jgi:type I restriction enzyme S subunit
LNEGVPLREIAQIFRGMPISSSKYSFEQDRNKVPYIRISDMQKGRIVRDKLKYININEIRDITRYIVKEGDLLFSIKGTIGKVALVDRQFDNSIASSQIAVLRSKKRDLNPNYLYYVLSSSTTKKQADLLKHGFIDGLSVMDLENIRIKLLPLEQQQRIVANIEREEERYEEATLVLQKSMADRITEIMDGITVHD